MKKKFTPKNNNKHNKNKLNNISKLPIHSLIASSRFEISGNREVIIDGCKCILEYDENIIRINVDKMQVLFMGRDLTIKCLNPDSLVIQGFITSIEFIT